MSVTVISLCRKKLNIVFIVRSNQPIIFYLMYFVFHQIEIFATDRSHDA